MKATLIKKIQDDRQRLYKLDTPVKFEEDSGEVCETLYVVTSTPVSGLPLKETYIFPANEDGDVVDWLELRGSIVGQNNHDLAIESFEAVNSEGGHDVQAN